MEMSLMSVGASQVSGSASRALLGGSSTLAENPHPVDWMSQWSDLQEHYERSAGVAEGYSIGEHSRRVVNHARHYRETLAPLVTPLVTWDEFELFLALHDIGKNLEGDAQGSVFSSPISQKSSELFHTQRIMSKTLHDIGMEPAKVELFKSLLMHDALGLFLRGIISQDEAYHQICEMARHAQVPVESLFQLFRAFHMADAGSYPGLMETCFSEQGSGRIAYTSVYESRIEGLHAALSQVRQGQELFPAVLHQLVEAKSKPQAVQRQALQRFLQTLPMLQSYVEQELHALIECVECNPSEVPPDHYRLLCKDGRAMLNAALDLGQALDPGLRATITSWADSLVHDDAREGGASQELIQALYRVAGIDGLHQDEGLTAFVFSMMDLRAQVLLIYKPDKVMCHVEAQRSSDDELPGDLPQRLRARFVHGTNTAVMLGLLQTDFHLVCMGRLRAAKIVPQSGECCAGSSQFGVNQTKISGCRLGGARAVIKGYARNTHFQAGGLRREKGALEHRITQWSKHQPKQVREWTGRRTWFLSKIYATTVLRHFFSEDDLDGSISDPFLPTAIRRMRMLDPGHFANHYEEDLKRLLAEHEEDLATFKTTRRYRDKMPASEVQGGKWHDGYWYDRLVRTHVALEELHRALEEPIEPISEVPRWMTQPGALVCASRTLPTCYYRGQHSQAEISGMTAAAMGSDIQELYVEENEIEPTREFLATHLQGRPMPQIHPIDELEKLALYSHQISSYTRNLFGRKWRQRLETAMQ